MTRARTTTCGLLLALRVAFTSPTNGADKADVLESLRTEHPRLLFTIEDQQRIETLANSDALLAKLIEFSRTDATKMLAESAATYDASRKKQRRSAGASQKVHQACRVDGVGVSVERGRKVC